MMLPPAAQPISKTRIVLNSGAGSENSRAIVASKAGRVCGNGRLVYGTAS